MIAAGANRIRASASIVKGKAAKRDIREAKRANDMRMLSSSSI